MHHHEKMQEALREAAAEFLSREASPQSLITVTRAMLSEDTRRVQIFITVYPDSQETPALAFANRNRADFSDFFLKKVRGVRAPHVEFVIDMGEKNRRRLDELSK